MHWFELGGTILAVGAAVGVLAFAGLVLFALISWMNSGSH